MKTYVTTAGNSRERFWCDAHGLQYPVYLYQGEALQEPTYVAAYCPECVVSLIERNLSPLGVRGEKK